MNIRVIRLILIFLNIIFFIFVSADYYSVFHFLAPLGRVHPILVHFVVSLVLAMLFIKSLKLELKLSQKNKEITEQTTKILLELAPLTGMILYFGDYNKLQNSSHFNYAFAFYFTYHIGNIVIIKSNQHKFLKIMITSILVLLLIMTSHSGGMENMGESWWIW